METPPPPPRSGPAAPLEDVVIPPTPDSEVQKSPKPSYAEIVRRSSPGHASLDPTQVHAEPDPAPPNELPTYAAPRRILSVIHAPTNFKAQKRVSFAPETSQLDAVREKSRWAPVRPRFWWRMAEFRGEASRPSSTFYPRRPHQSTNCRSSTSLQEFRRRTAGRCFKCLAKDHRAANCRDPLRCFSCHRLGHRHWECQWSASRPRQLQANLDEGMLRRNDLQLHPRHLRCNSIHKPSDHHGASARRSDDFNLQQLHYDAQRCHDPNLKTTDSSTVRHDVGVGHHEERRSGKYRKDTHCSCACGSRSVDDCSERQRHKQDFSNNVILGSYHNNKHNQDESLLAQGVAAIQELFAGQAATLRDDLTTLLIELVKEQVQAALEPIMAHLRGPQEEHPASVLQAEDLKTYRYEALSSASAGVTDRGTLVPVKDVFARLHQSLHICKQMPSMDVTMATQVDQAQGALSDAPLNHAALIGPVMDCGRGRFRPGFVYRRRVLSENRSPDEQSATLDPKAIPLDMADKQLVVTDEIEEVASLVNTPLTATPPSSPVTPVPARVAEMFVEKEMAILPQPQPTTRRTRTKKTFDPTNLRRSERQRRNRFRCLPMECARRVLCRCLGFTQEGANPVEHALQEYMALFNGPLPPTVIAALVALFKLDDKAFMARDEALVKLGGPDAAALLDETLVEEPMQS